MSDKNDSVEMSEELTAEDTPAKDNSVPLIESSDIDPQKTDDSYPIEENADQQDMGQIKSKVKKFREKRKEKDEDLEVEIAEPDGGFMCGVVEGFYGRPWTTGQRRELFRRMKAMGMNTYLYGPKDDYKHRLYWRDLYSTDETSLLKLLIDAAIEHDVLFIYAISPGLDMSFASPNELECLKNKLLQVQSLGCRAFALLFDDIDPILCAADKAQYVSAASAQAAVTNQMYNVLGGPRFLFCPTEYCTSMAIPDVSNSKYLETVGRELNKNISIMWTGPKVVSKYITVESIKQLTRILRRKVVIWDNIHANDYDPKRMFLGPYKGRSTDLIPHLAGVMTNPNCEFESNYIAMHTLAAWWKSYLKAEEKSKEPLCPPGEDLEEDKKVDVEMESDDKEETSAVPKNGQESLGLMSKEENKTDAILLASQSPQKVIEAGEASSTMDGEAKGDRAECVEAKDAEEKPKVKSSENQGTISPHKESEVTSANQAGSTSSSLVGSDDSDTDSDYSSHEDYYVLSRHSSSPPFDHGVYDPDGSLKEAIRSWLPYFFTSCLPHGKPVARSGPPLGMLSHCDVGLISNAAMGPMSFTTSALTNEPILSTNFPSRESDDCKTNSVEIENVESGKEETGVKPVGGDVEASVEKPEESERKRMEEHDVEMAGATLGPSASLIQAAVADLKSEPEDVKMRSDSDIDMNPPTTSHDLDEKKGISDSEDLAIKKIESTIQMETEDEEPMQLEPDQASDVSMATTQSNEEKKTPKTEVDDKESSVDMTTPPHQVTSLSPTPEPDDEGDEQRSCEEGHEIPHQFKIEPMTREDVELAVELFYLPYEHGNFGRKMVQEFVWLQSNIRQAVMPPNAPDSVKSESMDKALEWMERAIQFEDSCSLIRRMCNKLISCSNRALLYDLFPYFWDMKGVVSMLSSYVKWMGQFYLRHQPAISPEVPETGSNLSKPASSSSPNSSPIAVSSPQMPPLPPAAAWLGNDPEPWVFRGGLSGEFQRLLPVAMANDLFCHAIPCSPPASNTTYTIRPYLASDEKAVYNICLTTGNDGTDFADDFSGYEDLPGERLVGGLLTLSPQYCFVVEDDLGICGYLVGTADAKSFWKKHAVAFWPEVKKKYSPTENEPKVGEEVKRLLDEIRGDDSPDSYVIDNLYSSHPAYMQIAVHRRVTDPSIAKSMTVCMLSALKSHGIHGAHTTVRSSDCYMPDLYCRLGFREIRPLELSPTVLSPPCLSTKEDTFIVFGRAF